MKVILKGCIYVMTLICLLVWSTVAGEKVYFYHPDPAGTPLVMTDASGNVVWKADYKPFGEEFSITGSVDNKERFAGKEKDSETGFYYFGARYMRPEIGRFASPDSVGAVDAKTNKTNYSLLTNPQKLNPYAYSLNNPYRYIDPDGKIPWLLPLFYNLFLPSSANAPEIGDTQLIPSQTTGEFAVGVGTMEAGGIVAGRMLAGSKAIATRLAQRFAASPDRLSILGRVITSEGGIKTSETVARQLANERSYIPTSSILDVIGSGTRMPDPQGVAGQYMYRAPAEFGKSRGVLEVLVHEPSAEIRHVLYRSE